MAAAQRIALTIALVGCALAGAAAGTAKDTFALKGEVYTAFKIEMKDASNRDLKTIKAGTYRIKIEDKASIHNFHLVGPGVNKATSIPGKVETIWTVTLKPGKYTYFCDPHAQQMRHSFRVTP